MKSVWYIDQVEFRRLQEQVRDVSMNLKNKFRTSAYQVFIFFIYLLVNSPDIQIQNNEFEV